MKNTNKKTKPVLSRKVQDKLHLEYRRWDQFALLLAGVIVLACLVCNGRSFELGEPTMHGFLLWFLLCSAYPLMELLGLLNLLLGIPANPWMRFLMSREVLALGLLDIGTLLMLWGVWRFHLGRKLGTTALRTAGTFLAIYLAWGVLQFTFFFLSFVWTHGGFSSFHNHMQEPGAPRTVQSVKN